MFHLLSYLEGPAGRRVGVLMATTRQAAETLAEDLNLEQPWREATVIDVVRLTVEPGPLRPQLEAARARIAANKAKPRA